MARRRLPCPRLHRHRHVPPAPLAGTAMKGTFAVFLRSAQSADCSDRRVQPQWRHASVAGVAALGETPGRNDDASSTCAPVLCRPLICVMLAPVSEMICVLWIAQTNAHATPLPMTCLCCDNAPLAWPPVAALLMRSLTVCGSSTVAPEDSGVWVWDVGNGPRLEKAIGILEPSLAPGQCAMQAHARSCGACMSMDSVNAAPKHHATDSAG